LLGAESASLFPSNIRTFWKSTALVCWACAGDWPDRLRQIEATGMKLARTFLVTPQNVFKQDISTHPTSASHGNQPISTRRQMRLPLPTPYCTRIPIASLSHQGIHPDISGFLWINSHAPDDSIGNRNVRPFVTRRRINVQHS
jgi:hypothetical protein